MQESAGIPVPSEWGEDEVMVVVAPKPGRSIHPPALIDFLRQHPYEFMGSLGSGIRNRVKRK